MTGIVNQFTLRGWEAVHNTAHRARQPVSLGLSGFGWRVPALLTPAEAEFLASTALTHCTQPVGIDGIADHYRSDGEPGSLRASVLSEPLANSLWGRLQVALDLPRQFTSADHVDFDGHAEWQACGVSPLMRFMRYLPDAGRLVAHYDAPYIESRSRRTLFTVVLYLSSNAAGGETRFIQDPQDALPFEERDFADARDIAPSHQVIARSSPVGGDALVFEHRLLHDAVPVRQTDKLLLRTDVFFERVEAS